MADVTHTLRVPFDESRTFQLTGSAHDRSVMRSVAEDGYYAPDVVWFLRRIMEPDWVVLDVGANVGALALVVAGFVPQGRIHAFEPAPQNFAYLERNIAVNDVENVDAHQIALSDAAGEVVMSFDPDFGAGAHVSTRVAEGEQAVVRAVRLDDWASDLSRLDLVKLDVEGHELPVLRGAVRTLERFRPHLLVELNPVTQRRFGSETVDELWRALTGAYRWRYWLRSDGGLSWIASRRHLDLVLRDKGYVDVFLTDRPPARALQRSRVRAMAGGVRELVTLARAARRPPAAGEACFVVDPAYRITLDVGALTVTPAAPLRVSGRLRNDTTVWMGSSYPKHAYTLRHRWLDPSGAVVSENPVPTMFQLLAPGAATEFALDATAPAEPGHYQLLVSVVQEGFAWHVDLEPTLAATVAVTVA